MSSHEFYCVSYIPSAGPPSWKFRSGSSSRMGWKPKKNERNKTATLDAMVPVQYDLHKVTWLNEQKSMRILCDVNSEVETFQCNEQESAGVQNNNEWFSNHFTSSKKCFQSIQLDCLINKFHTMPFHPIPCWQYFFQCVVPSIPNIFLPRNTTTAF